MSFLASLSPDARVELEAFVNELVTQALCARDRAPQKRWLTSQEVADYLGCSRRAVYERRRRGRFPSGAIKHAGRALLFDRLAVDRMLERQ